VERHRLFWLAQTRLTLFSASDKILHFAPEACASQLIRRSCHEYRSADLQDGHADVVLNIEGIALPDESVDVVIASHVLEHVDDKAALSEIWRILKDRGRLIVMIPIIEGWALTYENPLITSAKERTAHFGQCDHVRYYGREFRERVESAGFSLSEFDCEGGEVVKYALLRGEKVFICRKG